VNLPVDQLRAVLSLEEEILPIAQPVQQAVDPSIGGRQEREGVLATAR
jgi:hypothetical protein